jgi:hypothetical protein
MLSITAFLRDLVNRIRENDDHDNPVDFFLDDHEGAKDASEDRVFAAHFLDEVVNFSDEEPHVDAHAEGCYGLSGEYQVDRLEGVGGEGQVERHNADAGRHGEKTAH